MMTKKKPGGALRWLYLECKKAALSLSGAAPPLSLSLSSPFALSFSFLLCSEREKRVKGRKSSELSSFSRGPCHRDSCWVPESVQGGGPRLKNSFINHNSYFEYGRPNFISRLLLPQRKREKGETIYYASGTFVGRRKKRYFTPFLTRKNVAILFFLFNGCKKKEVSKTM